MNTIVQLIRAVVGPGKDMEAPNSNTLFIGYKHLTPDEHNDVVRKMIARFETWKQVMDFGIGVPLNSFFFVVRDEDGSYQGIAKMIEHNKLMNKRFSYVDYHSPIEWPEDQLENRGKDNGIGHYGKVRSFKKVTEM